MDNINGGLAGAMSSPLFSLGAGLLQAGTTPMGSVGTSLMNAGQNYYASQKAQQDLYMNRLNMQLLQQSMPAAMQALHAVGGLLDPPNAQQPSQQQAQQQPQNQQQPQSQPQPQASGLMAPGGAQPSAAGGLMSGGAPQPPMPQQVPQQAPQQAPQQGLPDPWALLMRGTQAQMVPMPGPMGDMVRQSGKAAVEAANSIFEHSPAYITATATAKDQITQDQAQLDAAMASRDPLKIAAARMKYLTDSKAVDIANNNNAVTTFGGITPEMLGMSASNPGQGTQTINGVQTPIPGAIGTQAALAGAKAGAESAAEYAPIYDAKGNQIGFAPRSAILSRPPGAPGSAPGAAGAGGAPSFGLGPSAHAQLAGTGEASAKYIENLQTQADNATQTNYALDQMITAARGAQIGPGAGARQWVENAAAALGSPFGIKPPKELANYQDLAKYGNQIAFAATRQMGSREAAQIVEMQLKSNPNAQLTPDAFADLTQSMRAMNSYVIAKNSAVQGVATDQASALKAASLWTSKIDPRVWDLSLGPDLAKNFAGQIGVTKIATALPVMASDDALRVMRNLQPAMQGQVLRGLPPEVKAEILQGLQAGQQSGATGTY